MVGWFQQPAADILFDAGGGGFVRDNFTGGGEYLHADIFEMAAAYLYHLVMNHPFVDGNKRVGLEAALIFLEINNENLNASDEELVDLVLKTTAGQIGKREIEVFFRSHCA